MEKIPYLGHTLTRWRVGPSTFLAWPENGARLLNWTLTLGDGSIRDVLHWPANASLDNVPKVRGGNPILFPFSGRCFDNGEIFFWRDPKGVRRPIPIHGIARQSPFEVVRSDARGFAARMLPGEEARASYPFEYEFIVTYRFEAVGLSCEFTLENKGGEPIPWSAGHHFYFTLPWSEGTRREDYTIRIPASRHSRQDALGKMVPGPALKAEESMANPELIDTHYTDLRAAEAVFGNAGKAGEISIRNGVDPVPVAGASFVTWTEAPDSPFYCVEPWMGAPNAPENKLGLHWVQPGATDAFSVRVAIN